MTSKEEKRHKGFLVLMVSHSGLHINGRNQIVDGTGHFYPKPQRLTIHTTKTAAKEAKEKRLAQCPFGETWHAKVIEVDYNIK